MQNFGKEVFFVDALAIRANRRKVFHKCRIVGVLLHAVDGLLIKDRAAAYRTAATLTTKPARENSAAIRQNLNTVFSEVSRLVNTSPAPWRSGT